MIAAGRRDTVPVIRQCGRQIAHLPQRTYAALVFCGLFRLGTGQAVKAGARVGVQITQRFVLLHHIAEDLDQGGVFEDIGVVAGMEGVAVGEHGGSSIGRRSIQKSAARIKPQPASDHSAT
ncbi:MAG: hypothetical protein NVV73_15245 [Cellvibrionaceae bacterium]|nr:hypothetical protein [Cellvibrionaceae bacterium]